MAYYNDFYFKTSESAKTKTGMQAHCCHATFILSSVLVLPTNFRECILSLRNNCYKNLEIQRKKDTLTRVFDILHLRQFAAQCSGVLQIMNGFCATGSVCAQSTILYKNLGHCAGLCFIDHQYFQVNSYGNLKNSKHTF